MSEVTFDKGHLPAMSPEEYVLGVDETMWQTADIMRSSGLHNRIHELYDRIYGIEITGGARPETLYVELWALSSAQYGFGRLTA
jgi:hypothetical protein